MRIIVRLSPDERPFRYLYTLFLIIGWVLGLYIGFLVTANAQTPAPAQIPVFDSSKPVVSSMMIVDEHGWLVFVDIGPGLALSPPGSNPGQRRTLSVAVPTPTPSTAPAPIVQVVQIPAAIPVLTVETIPRNSTGWKPKYEPIADMGALFIIDGKIAAVAESITQLTVNGNQIGLNGAAFQPLLSSSAADVVIVYWRKKQ